MARNKVIKTLLVLVASFFAYLFLFPLFFMLLTSFKGLSESISASSLLPQIWTLDNYRQLLGDATSAPILRWLFNTALVTVVGTSLVVFVDVLAAYALARLNLPGAKKILVLIIWIMAVPGIVTLFPSFYLFKTLGLTDNFIPLILPYSANVMGVYLIYNFLKDFPKELEEAAFVDGASLLKILRYIILPSIKPVVATLAFITFISIYNDYLWPSLIVGTNEMRTITVGIASLILGANFVNPGIMMAATLFAITPAIIIFLLVNKQVAKGVTNVGIK